MIDFKKIKAFFSGDGEEESNLNRFMKKKQHVVGIIFIFLLLVGIVVLHSLSAKKEQKPHTVKVHDPAIIDGVLSTDFTKQNEMSALEHQQSTIDGLVENLEQLSKQSAEEKENSKLEKAELMEKINSIVEKNKKESSSKALPAKKAVSQATSLPPIPSSEGKRIDAGAPLLPAQEIENIQFNYESKKIDSKPNLHDAPSFDERMKNVKTPKTYVPAGTFARGVLLEGADANASVNGQSDTVGILVRILDSGTLPNGHHSHLKGCFVLASIYGDISSERGEARLTKLSCTRSDGSILEKKVEGYLSFAGKEGIKGRPVMRNGQVLMMAGLSGMLSGFGSALQQSSQTQSISALGSTTSVSPADVWKNGAYGGANTAMSQLANYYIQRADQYHPIIEIGSGTVATVIFQSGFSLVDEIVHAEQSTVPSVSQAVTTGKSAQEIKDLLREAQSMSSSTSNAPFSNVN